MAGMNERHGNTKHPIYRSWAALRYRCSSGKNPCYGGRGIAVCAEWDSFPVFFEWALSTGWREGLTIDRIDVDGNYEPANCRWATAAQQGANKRPKLAVLIDGRIKSVLQWSRATGIPQATLYKRYHAGIRGRAFLAPPINPATPKGPNL